MPFKSRAQRRKFAELLVKGEISEETFEEWNRETGGAKLPERVKPSKKRSSKPTSRKRVGKAKAGSKSKGKRRSVTKRPVRRKNT
jgi:hypothetical protein